MDDDAVGKNEMNLYTSFNKLEVDKTSVEEHQTDDESRKQ